MYALVFVTLFWNLESSAITVEVLPTMDQCFELREIILDGMRDKDGKLINNVQALCIKTSLK